MNVSFRWLKELAPALTESPEAVAEALGMLGAPVEEMVRPGAGLGDIVIARVIERGEHPNADRLSLCRVDAGGDELQVVCGAPVIEEGALYPFAPVGATLPGGMTIRKAKIRGEYSQGMLCSETELGLGRDSSGIMRLADSYDVGAPFVEALGLDDTRLTLEVTPNRPDLLSHVGVAREIGPQGHQGIQLPPFPAEGSEERTDATLPALTFRREETDGLVEGTRVLIDDPASCPRYIAAVIEDVEVGPSPSWLASRLRAIGQRPINNVVDATNYILHELGQPLHAFDLDRLEGPAILVRPAADGETITTLDDVERKLTADMLVIADDEGPVAVAGVMGGADSEVTSDTTRVLLECAYFDPRSVRATARALSLSTDASYRFERGTDIDGMERAAHRAVELIEAVAGGRVSEDAVDIYPAPQEAPRVSVRPGRVAQVLGADIEAEEIARLLRHIGFEFDDEDDDALTFRVPGFRRHDVTREIDLIEEVARRFGYDRLDDRLRPYRPTTVPDAPLSVLEDDARRLLSGRGLLEARGISMAPEGAGEVPLLRPLSAEEGYLRSTIAFGLLRATELNMARGVRDVRLFEIGTTFHSAGAGERPREDTRLALALTGASRPRHWTGESPDWDLWDLRGLAEDLMARLDPEGWEVVPLEDDPGELALPSLYRSGTVMELRAHGQRVGVAGEVSENAIDAPAWSGPSFALEVRLTDVMARPRRPTLEPVPTQPASDRDLALVVPGTTPSAAVMETIRSSAGELLEAVRVFDVYEGEGVPEGYRSIAYRLVFRHPERTLKDAEVDRAVERVLERLKDVHGVERRG